MSRLIVIVEVRNGDLDRHGIVFNQDFGAFGANIVFKHDADFFRMFGGLYWRMPQIGTFGVQDWM